MNLHSIEKFRTKLCNWHHLSRVDQLFSKCTTVRYKNSGGSSQNIPATKKKKKTNQKEATLEKEGAHGKKRAAPGHLQSALSAAAYNTRALPINIIEHCWLRPAHDAFFHAQVFGNPARKFRS